jgi:hypothetical protein
MAAHAVNRGLFGVTGVAGDTAFSPESGKFHDSFWQGIADGVGDQDFRRSG